MALASTFEGFSRDLPEFLADLEANNTKSWFDAHRADYEELYLEPAKQFVAAMTGPIAKVATGAKAEPRVNGSIMRINKDVRFSKDKTPYKPYLSLVFPVADAFDRKAPAFWFRLSTSQLRLGCGMMDFGKNGLKTYRDTIADPKGARAFASLIDKAAKAGGWERSMPHYKTVPRDYPLVKEAGGLQADLIRHSGFHMGISLAHPDALFSPKAAQYVCSKFKGVAPVTKWLVDVVGTAH